MHVIIIIILVQFQSVSSARLHNEIRWLKSNSVQFSKFITDNTNDRFFIGRKYENYGDYLAGFFDGQLGQFKAYDGESWATEAKFEVLSYPSCSLTWVTAKPGEKLPSKKFFGGFNLVTERSMYFCRKRTGNNFIPGVIGKPNNTCTYLSDTELPQNSDLHEEDFEVLVITTCTSLVGSLTFWIILWVGSTVIVGCVMLFLTRPISPCDIPASKFKCNLDISQQSQRIKNQALHI